MPEKRLLSHYKIDAKRERLLMVSCNAEDMVLPRSNFIFYGKYYLQIGISFRRSEIYVCNDNILI